MNDLYCTISLEQKFVAYAPKVDEIFVYWVEEDILHCLGEKGKYQICWIDEVTDDSFLKLGEY